MGKQKINLISSYSLHWTDFNFIYNKRSSCCCGVQRSGNANCRFFTLTSSKTARMTKRGSMVSSTLRALQLSSGILYSPGLSNRISIDIYRKSITRWHDTGKENSRFLRMCNCFKITGRKCQNTDIIFW